MNWAGPTRTSLTATTGPEHKVTIKPAEGEVFTKFKILTTGKECFFSTAMFHLLLCISERQREKLCNFRERGNLVLAPLMNFSSIKA